VPRLRRLVAAWVAAAAATGLACAHRVSPAPPGVERVVFVGDSLVNRPDQDHGLLGLVQMALERSHPGVALDLVNAGSNGDGIADIRARLAQDVLALRPAAVVLYWDSDAADVEDRAAFAWLAEHATAPYRDSGSLTEDGQHLNAAGTELVAAEMASALGRWLSGRAAARPVLEEPAGTDHSRGRSPSE
jgi:lysophospholipase L1-like esterase